MKTPNCYVAPLKSRAEICAWLLDRSQSNQRPGYGLFCYDVKLRRLKTDFAHAWKTAKEAGNLLCQSERYKAECAALWEDKMETAFEIGTEDAAESVMDCDTHRMLWNGNKAVAVWGFDGHSGGWLCLKEFESVNLSIYSGEELFGPENDSGFAWLRNLYRFLVQCDHDFRRPETEIEYLAADWFFCNAVDGIETDKQIADQAAAASQEQSERAHWEARDTVTAP